MPLGPVEDPPIKPGQPAEPPQDAYRSALSFRDRLAEVWDRLTAGFGAVLLPSAAAEAPLGSLDDQDPAPAALGSLLGLPAVNIPLFTSRGGMPLGARPRSVRVADDRGRVRAKAR